VQSIKWSDAHFFVRVSPRCDLFGNFNFPRPQPEYFQSKPAAKWIWILFCLQLQRFAGKKLKFSILDPVDNPEYRFCLSYADPFRIMPKQSAYQCDADRYF